MSIIRYTQKNLSTTYDYESGVFYYDSVKIFPDDELEKAIEFGRQNGQLAIFWLTKQQEIRL